MNIAFFQFSSNSMHFAASLEILSHESSAPNKNFYSIWGGKTKYLERRALGFKALTPFRLSKPFKLIQKIDSKINLNPKFEYDKKWVNARLKEFESRISGLRKLEDLQKMKLGELNPSAALVNEVVSLTKFRDADLSKVKNQIRKLLRSYLEVYSATSMFIEKHEIEKVHLYNGRFIHERAVWDCIKANNLEISLFEVMRNRYLQRSNGFHDRTENQRIIRSHWEQSGQSLEEKIKIGSEYFVELRGNSNPFIKIKTVQLKLDKPYFVFFTNSDDEAVGFWEVWEEKLGNQIECVTKLQDYFESQNEYALVIRIHPNLLNKSQNAIKAWEHIVSRKNSIVIGPGDAISSYEILDNSQGSISFGTTLSIEAAYARIPSLVLADCAYDELGAVDKLSDWNQVYNWIENVKTFSNSQLELRRINSCLRGYYLSTYGLNFQNTVLSHREWGSWDAISFLDLNFNRYFLSDIVFLLEFKIRNFLFLKKMEGA